MVISGRALGIEGYRFEARKGNDSLIVREFPSACPAGALSKDFPVLARQMCAIIIAEAAASGGVA